MTEPEIHNGGSCAGLILVAHPELRDPNFAHTLVVVVEHSDNGAFGIIVNRSLNLSLQQMAQRLSLSWGGGDHEEYVGFGGPVMLDTVWAIHDGSRGIGVSKRITDEIAFSAEANAIRSLLLEPAGQYRIVMGYAGWGARQLEAELAGGFWFTVPAEADLCFGNDGEALWRRALEGIGINPETSY